MGDDFVALLKARNEAAMTIVLYYSLILKIAGGDCWLMDGWGFKLSTEVSGLIVNQPWVGFAQWPIAEMGRLMSPSQEVYVEDPWGLD
jgi:hypothetical protein